VSPARFARAQKRVLWLMATAGYIEREVAGLGTEPPPEVPEEMPEEAQGEIPEAAPRVIPEEVPPLAPEPEPLSPDSRRPPQR
jgi:hypothetical protein